MSNSCMFSSCISNLGPNSWGRGGGERGKMCGVKILGCNCIKIL